MKNKIKYIHFVGIGGSGMSGIAEIMHNMKFEVSGSDTHQSQAVKHLESRGIKIFSEHKKENINNVDVVVVSSAISNKNPEISRAKKNNIPIIPRAEMLAELMRFKEGIAIAGTHGKTSTTSILASIMNEAGLDPTYVIGGRINSLKQSARLGKSEIMIVEADESDASFLHLNPSHILVTNIDNDHMETYGNDEARLIQTFIDFIHQVPFYNDVFLCNDDKKIKSIIKRIARPVITFGLTKKSDIYADKIKIKGNSSVFRVCSTKFDIRPFFVEIKMPGRHYISNTLGAIAIALSYRITPQSITKSLKDFDGVARRFDFYDNYNFNGKKIILIDDYGHHPTEIDAVLKSIRNGFPRKRINLVFQPHRFSRTLNLLDEFIATLSKFDQLFLFDIYSAGEKEIKKLSSKNLIKKINCNTTYLKDMESAKELIEGKINDNEILLIMGAGSIGTWVKDQFLNQYND